MTFARIKSTSLGLILFLYLLIHSTVFAQVEKVTVVTDENGSKLQVNGKDFMANGMNWDYFPIGENYSYSLWTQPEDLIKDALDAEMSLLKNMGVNTIRVYTGIQPKWIQYIYENYGIYTMLNHSFGRYGLTINGKWVAVTDYSDEATKELLLSEVNQLVKNYKNTPGLLLYLLGNENNYGLFWAGAETEDFPDDDAQKAFVGENRGRPMYKLMNDAAVKMKAIDSSRPVAICNGDVLFIDIIAEECKDVDIYGVNAYRGISFTDMFDVVKEKLNMPILFTEFGSDAFNAKEMREDQKMQAYYMVGNWKEIYENAYGLGKAGNSVGGFTFQFSDGWWKYGQTTDLDVHNTAATWANGGYPIDLTPGENNMNEEWFGICAKGPTNARGLYQLYPRAAYYALQEAHKIDVYNPAVDLQTIEDHFNSINLMAYVLKARGDKAALGANETQSVRVSGLRLEFETFSTGGSRISTPDDIVEESDANPAFLGFDHMQSFYAEIEAQPAANINGKLSLNVLGNVPRNRIDEIFYENRGLPATIELNGEQTVVNSFDRVKVYNASISWDDKWFKLDGFYRTGHYHWGYEGDFFGLYPEANYGSNIDIYNGAAPLGFEIEGKKSLEGLKVAFGPELWWGANPAILIKYSRKVGPFELTGIFHEDIDEQGETVSSIAIPEPPTRRATIHAEVKHGIFGLELGGIWSGSTKIEEPFQIAVGNPGSYRILQDKIEGTDAFGGKVKVTIQSSSWNWYAEGSAKGIVADGGVNQALTFTGWRLKESGLGNQWSFLTGLAYNMGDWQIAPNFLYQKPVEGPIPNDVPAPGRPRDILSDPFAVRGNRETTASELLITYDPTPTTWMYDWDSDIREDAKLAFNLGFIFRHQPTTRDAEIGILQDGRTIFAFPGAPPARDLWEVHSRIVSKLSPGFGLIANLYAGEGEPKGSDKRLIHRYGADVRLAMKFAKLVASAKINDWGPYDYHRDFNLTYPLQFTADVSTQLGLPEWFDVPQTRFGVRFAWRSLDQYSPRYCPTTKVDVTGEAVCDPKAIGFEEGTEWEIRTYLHLNFGM